MRDELRRDPVNSPGRVGSAMSSAGVRFRAALVAASLISATLLAQGGIPLSAPRVESLVNELRDAPDPARRAQAAARLAQAHDRRAVEPLIAALRDPDLDVRMNSALALGTLGDPRAVGPLLALPHDEAHRACMSLALGHLKDRRAVGALLGQLTDDNPDNCQNVAVALVLLGDAESVAPLIVALGSAKSVVRRGAAYALGFLDSRQAVPPLIGRLVDDDAVVRQSAVDSLQRLKDARAIEPLRALARSDPDEAIRKRARVAVEVLSRPASAPKRPGPVWEVRS